MENQAFGLYQTVDPALKDAVWGSWEISLLRRDWRPIVNPETNAKNKNYLFSKQDMTRTAELFKAGGDFRNETEFIPLPILENIKNFLIEEITKNPPKAELKANDPTAISDKKEDIFKLKNRKVLEGAVNQSRRRMKLPDYKMPATAFKGNIQDFDKMGFSEDDDDDVNFFEAGYQRTNYEIAGQAVINAVMKLNRFNEDSIEDFVIDILANKVITMQVYVDKITGELKYGYIYPETFRGIFGKSSDGRDDICSGYEKSVTVNEWLSKVGNEFNWERDWKDLLWAINYRNNFTYTGFRKNGREYDCLLNEKDRSRMGFNDMTETNYCNWDIAYTYEVFMGYIEWKSPEITSNYKIRTTKENGREVVSSIPANYKLSDDEIKEGYDTDPYYQQQTYCSYFIATSSLTQWLYGFGKFYFQTLHGAHDEFSSGSLWYYRKRGKSAVELSIPYLKLANDAFYKMLWAVYEAHPDWDVFQVEEIVELSRIMYSQAATPAGGSTPVMQQDQLTKLITFFKENLVKLKAVPRVDGKPQVNLNSVPAQEKRGLDPISIAMQTVCTWAEAQIMQKLGINDMRMGSMQSDRQSYKQSAAETQYSFNSTGYIYRMIQFMNERVATTTLSLSQDMLKYKGTLPYKWLKKIIGEEMFIDLKSLDNFCAHRYAIFVQDINTQIDRQRIIAAADRALDSGDGRGGLTYSEWFMVTQTEDYKKAIKLLDFLKMKKDKKDRKQKLQDQQAADQQAQKLQQMQQDTEKMKGQLSIQKAQIEADAIKYVADKNAQSKTDVKQMTIEAEPGKQDSKSAAQENIVTHKEAVKNQQPFQ